MPNGTSTSAFRIAATYSSGSVSTLSLDATTMHLSLLGGLNAPSDLGQLSHATWLSLPGCGAAQGRAMAAINDQGSILVLDAAALMLKENMAAAPLASVLSACDSGRGCGSSTTGAAGERPGAGSRPLRPSLAAGSCLCSSLLLDPAARRLLQVLLTEGLSPRLLQAALTTSTASTAAAHTSALEPAAGAASFDDSTDGSGAAQLAGAGGAGTGDSGVNEVEAQLALLLPHNARKLLLDIQSTQPHPIAEPSINPSFNEATETDSNISHTQEQPGRPSAVSEPVSRSEDSFSLDDDAPRHSSDFSGALEASPAAETASSGDSKPPMTQLGFFAPPFGKALQSMRRIGAETLQRVAAPIQLLKQQQLQPQPSSASYSGANSLAPALASVRLTQHLRSLPEFDGRLVSLLQYIAKRRGRPGKLLLEWEWAAYEAAVASSSVCGRLAAVALVSFRAGFAVVP